MVDQEAIKRRIQACEHQLQFKRAQLQALNEVIEQLEQVKWEAEQNLEEGQTELPGLNGEEEDSDGAA